MVINIYQLFLHTMVIISLWLMYSNLNDITNFIISSVCFIYYMYRLHNYNNSNDF